MVTLQSFRILAEASTAFVCLTEHIDYSSPEGKLQLTILAAFSAYFSDMLAAHVSKGKGERAAQGLFNGDIPFGYRRTGKRTPPEPDPKTFPGLQMIGELWMMGMTAAEMAHAVMSQDTGLLASDLANGSSIPIPSTPLPHPFSNDALMRSSSV